MPANMPFDPTSTLPRLGLGRPLAGQRRRSPHKLEGLAYE